MLLAKNPIGQFETMVISLFYQGIIPGIPKARPFVKTRPFCKKTGSQTKRQAILKDLQIRRSYETQVYIYIQIYIYIYIFKGDEPLRGIIG